MHRDLKPENILLDGDTPKIGDLGLSRVLENELSTTLVGTQSYMAPEMLEEGYGIEIDLWALGVIFLELLIGKRLWVILKGEKIPAKSESFPKAKLLEMI
jgi:eukaryotic-like serine/threonine-protein kinase